MAFRSTSALTDGAAGTITWNSPPGVQQNDIVTLVLYASYASTVTVPSGFTEPTGSPIQATPIKNDNTISLYYHVYQKVAGADEPSTYTTTQSSELGWQGYSIAHSGRNTSSYLDFITPTWVNCGGSEGAQTFPLAGGTAAAGDDLLWVAISGGTAVAMTWTAPSGFTSEFTGQNGTTTPSQNLSVYNDYGAGATGTLTGTASGTDLFSDAVGFVIALKQASAPAVSPSQFFFGLSIAPLFPLAPLAWVIDRRRRLAPLPGKRGT